MRSRGFLLLNRKVADAVAQLKNANSAELLDALNQTGSLLGQRGAAQAAVEAGVLSPTVRSLDWGHKPDIHAAALRLVVKLSEHDYSSDLRTEVRSAPGLLEGICRALKSESDEVIVAAADAVGNCCYGDLATQSKAAIGLGGLTALTTTIANSNLPAALKNEVATAIGILVTTPETLENCCLVLNAEEDRNVSMVKSCGSMLTKRDEDSCGKGTWVLSASNPKHGIIELYLENSELRRLKGRWTKRQSDLGGTLDGEVRKDSVRLVLESDDGTAGTINGTLKSTPSDAGQSIMANLEQTTADKMMQHLARMAEQDASAEAELALHALGKTSTSDIHEYHLRCLVTMGLPKWQQRGSAENVRKDALNASIEDVCLFVYESGFQLASGLCAKNNIDGKLLKALSDVELKTELELVSLDERKRMRLCIEVLGAFLGRYRILKGRVVHKSPTCTLVFGVDVLSGDEVALKFMHHWKQFQREISMRTADEKSVEQLDSKFVIGIQAHYDLVELNVNAAAYDSRLSGQYVLVMDRADRDLVDSLAHDGIAGKDKNRVRRVVRDIIAAAGYMNDTLRRTHGDLKPRNFVESTSGGQSCWKIVDLDATVVSECLSVPFHCQLERPKACRSRPQMHGTPLSEKHSSGFVPPEKARQLRNGGRPLIATSAYDMFSLGMVIFQLCAVDGSTCFFTNVSDDLVSHDDLGILAGSFQSTKHKMLSRIHWLDARDLVLWMLQAAEADRPQSFSALLLHPFVNEGPVPSYGLRYEGYRGLDLPPDCRYHFFLSHNQREAGDIAHTIYEALRHLGFMIWYDQAEDDITLQGMRRGARE
eukprot:SAG31_NODE_2822_length_5036_cov_2.054049_3_plen_823_part_00